MMNRFSRILLPLLLILCGCSTYTIDSRPQGLRVTYGNVEYGVTPCQLKVGITASPQFIAVYPPSKQQWRQYEKEQQKIVSTFYTETQIKYLSNSTPSGKILFDFVAQEYDVPTTEEEKKWVEAQLKDDAERLEREKSEQSNKK